MKRNTTILDYFRVSANEDDATAAISSKKRKVSNSSSNSKTSSKRNEQLNYSFLLLYDSERKSLFPKLISSSRFHVQSQEWTWQTSEPVRMKKIPETHQDTLLHLYTNIPVLKVPFSSSDPPHPTSSSSPPPLTAPDYGFTVIKSMIQKGVRRQLGKEVFNLATFVCQSSFHNFKELVRRILVIALEDVTLHPGLPILSWIMVAFSKGFVPDDLQLFHSITISILLDLSSFPVKDWLPSCTSSFSYPDVNSNQHSFHLTEKPEVHTLLSSIWIRQAYGGLKGDISMLAFYYQQWKRRVSNEEHTYVNVPSLCGTFFQPVFPYLCSDYLEGLARQHEWMFWLLQQYAAGSSQSRNVFLELRPGKQSLLLIEEGWDFHCDWAMLTHVAKAVYPEIMSSKPEPQVEQQSETLELDPIHENEKNALLDKIKRCIWLFRSSINERPIWKDRCTSVEKEELEREKKLEIDEKANLHSFWKSIEMAVIHYSNRRCSLSSLKSKQVEMQ